MVYKISVMFEFLEQFTIRCICYFSKCWLFCAKHANFGWEVQNHKHLPKCNRFFQWKSFAIICKNFEGLFGGRREGEDKNLLFTSICWVWCWTEYIHMNWLIVIFSYRLSCFVIIGTIIRIVKRIIWVIVYTWTESNEQGNSMLAPYIVFILPIYLYNHLVLKMLNVTFWFLSSNQ